jgi:DNA repair protein SbcC/Rad50
MCYRYAELDMSDIKLACLSGDNGAGKSAILDSITWSLWGEARVKSADELITMNEIEMSVSLTFEVGDQVYQVIRKRNRKGSGTTLLELQIRKENGWTRIESGANPAQRKILEVIKMSHDTFINSAYLQQGKADEFTRRTATQRKEILCDILGLSYYDELEKRAKDAAKLANDQRKTLEETLQSYERELAKRPVYEEEYHEAETLVLHSQKQIDQQQHILEERKNFKNVLDTLHTQLSNAEKRLENSNKELTNLRRRKEEIQRQLKIAQQVLDRRQEIEQGYQEYQIAHEAEYKISQKQKDYFDFDKKRQRLEALIDRAKGQLENEQSTGNRQLREQTELANSRAFLQDESKALHTDLAKANQAFEDIEQKKKELATYRESIAAGQSEIKRLEREMADLKKKADQVPQPGDKCGQCGTVLDENAREHTLSEYREAYKLCQNQAKEAKTQDAELKTKLELIEGQIKSLEKPASARSELTKRAGTLEEKLKAAEQAHQAVQALHEQLAALQQRLDNKQYALDEQKELVENAAVLKGLGYSPEAHQRAIT